MKRVEKRWYWKSITSYCHDKDAGALAMTRVSPLVAAVVISLGAWICSTQAQTTWNSAPVSTADRNTTGAGSFTWSTTGAWDANGVANGAGLSVSLEPRLTANTLVTVDNTYTLGKLTSRCNNFDIRFSGSGKLIFDNGSTPTFWHVHSYATRFTTLRSDIYVDVQLNSDLDIRMGAARQEVADVGRIGKTISGSGALTLTLGNNDSSATRLFKIGHNGANTYQGGTTIRHISQIAYGANYVSQSIVQLNAVTTGAFGTGHVTIDGAGCTATCSLTGVGTGRGMWVRMSASDAITNGATLNLVTASRIALELAAGTTQTLGILNVDGTPVANGTYTGGSFDWLYGTGTLIVGSGGAPMPEIAILGSNGAEILNSSTTVSEGLGTDFGEILWIGSVSRTNAFAITNSGLATLTLSGAPVTVLGEHSADFTVIQPGASTIPAGASVTFMIACDPSVVGVRTGLVSIASDDSNENPYTFRIQSTGIPEQISFQQGDGSAFSDTAFTYIQERYDADDNFGTDVLVQLEEEYRVSPDHMIFQGLLAFPDIIGKANGQIYPESTVTSATLTLTVSDDGSTTIPVTLHQMLKPWVENEATWSERSSGLSFGNGATNPLDNAAALTANPADPIDDGGGLPGVDYVEASTASHVAYPVGKVSFNVTSVVQAWANGTPNYGIFLQYLSDNGIKIHSDDAVTLSDRPRLVVSYTPPPPKGTMVSFR